MTTRFVVAGVCLLDNPLSIDTVYDYRIPEELAEEVFVGAFVTVPFGTANHRRIALVRELKERSSYHQLKALVSVCSERLALGEEMLGREGHRGNSWELLDYGTIVVHVFTEEAREFYSLERLWADAESIDISQIVIPE